ncbi:MAG: penicillin-binding transpeptidase domain-containing protein, partial [Planctomycetota bacterium]|nr:penicillin-binding transpeptidase domain-containing protein [Planctomycetota bacterium]
EVGVTALQMVRAFSAFARDGEMAGTIPRLRMTASRGGESGGVIYRVLPGKVAELTRETLTHVVASMESKYAKAAPDGNPWKYTLFGKSGTARPPAPPFGYLQHQYVPSFIAAGPYENPKLVTLVVIDEPGPERVAKRTYYGAATSGPIVRAVMERALTYLGEKPSEKKVASSTDSTKPME